MITAKVYFKNKLQEYYSLNEQEGYPQLNNPNFYKLILPQHAEKLAEIKQELVGSDNPMPLVEKFLSVFRGGCVLVRVERSVIWQELFELRREQWRDKIVKLGKENKRKGQRC